MSNPASGMVLSGPSLVLSVGLLLVLVAVIPVTGRWSHRRFLRTVRRDPDARLYRYRRTVATEWVLLVACVGVVLGADGLRLGHVGVALPRLTGSAAPVTVVGGLGLVATAGALVAVRHRLDRHPEPQRPVGPEAVVALLPRTFRERRAFTGLAVTAGTCEELCYRGFLIAVVTALAPGWGSSQLVLASAVGFGLAHAYQGLLGIVLTSLLGGCLAVLYLGTGSLLLPVFYHVLLDLRVLLLPVPGGPPAAGRHVRRDPPGGGRARRRR
ncbi:MAG: CPBP family intramembrane metalloprotease [Actinobacteria bacterium]|nr:CPBP family intramembrane metalloprotease [Actinomycetota bacterium]